MQIIMNKPKERYVIDLTYLHFDFKNLLDKNNIVFIHGIILWIQVKNIIILVKIYLKKIKLINFNGHGSYEIFNWKRLF